MEREERYITLKHADVDAALNKRDKAVLFGICTKVHAHRNKAGKAPLQCVVVESDWPEYEPTWKAIAARVDGGPAIAVPFNSDEAKALIDRELEAMLQRCVAAGMTYSAAKMQLGLNLVLPAVLTATFGPEVKNGGLIRKAYAAHLAKDAVLCQAYSLEWLKRTHGAELGTLVAVSGWVEPREVLIDRFEFSWSDDRDPLDCVMVFEGPTAFKTGVGVKANVTAVNSHVAVRKAPSRRLYRQFPDRFST